MPVLERIHVVTYFWDRSRRGIADFRGSPHAFDCIFDDRSGEYSDVYRLKSIDPEIFGLALEQWAIWLDWQAAYQRGEVAPKTHPAISHQPERYVQLDTILRPALEVQEVGTITAVARFRRDDDSEDRRLKVSWELIE